MPNHSTCGCLGARIRDGARGMELPGQEERKQAAVLVSHLHTVYPGAPAAICCGNHDVGTVLARFFVVIDVIAHSSGIRAFFVPVFDPRRSVASLPDDERDLDLLAAAFRRHFPG